MTDRRVQFIKEFMMQGDFKIAAAQFGPVRGDVEENTRRHLQLIAAAVAEGANVVIFPELSLTGYEPDLARELAFTDADSRWAPFQAVAREQGVTLMVGAPVRMEEGEPQVGLFVISPETPVFHYSKMHLHPGEDQHFAPGAGEKVFELQGVALGLAICADTGVATHARNTAAAGAAAYLSSVLITAGGYDEDTAKLQDYAQTHGMCVIMANFSGPSGGWEPIGKSAVWSPGGDLLAQGPQTGDALVIGVKTEAGWSGLVKSI
ncbi:predicted amidohydrolase [Hahella chejuensis KCTC 2396]|uniref:Predicted amidohydrolase n=1 Tax=Hahella chejuensis (strain KCTC 2396) TaxID=349521 RepID=Q2SKF4_HAHCH|nr:carbon-nitrogen hydrolase family protein [Hahella chejuensis]ABC28870.1 predicted amidohydrolase [Hahella chejuensis KCTC 2396]